MTTIFTIPLSDMAVKPSAIFLAKKPRSSYWWSVSLGFAAHEHHFNIIGKKNNLFFEHCESCVYYRDKSCPGGERILLDSRSNNLFLRSAYSSNVNIHNGTFCRKLFDDPDKRKSLKEGIKGVKVTLPDYFLTTGKCYQDYDNESGMMFSYLRQDLIEENDESTFWKASPAPFPNTYETSGSICTGRNNINDWGNFGELQSIFLNQIYNYDLFYTSNYGFNDLESCLSAMNFDKFLEVTLKKRKQGNNVHILVPFNHSDINIAKKILPPIYEKIWIDGATTTVKLQHSNGSMYSLPSDLSGEPVLEVVN